ncbi:MAG: hypothetical protein IVW57_06665, partial [Ktedonobacterales bacterium]|nr:hypothetical protein [Ktedonobacterales bacterium]
MSLAGDPFASARAVSVGTSSSQGPALLHRRTLLIAAGGGVVTVSGLAVATKHWHLLARLRSKFSTTLQGLGVGPADARPPFPDGPLSTTRDLVIFNGSLGTGWQDWSWAKRRLPDTSAMHEGQAAATFDANNWTGLYLHGGTFDTTGYIYVQCWVRGADAGGQAISVWLVNAANAWVGGALLGEYTREGGITRGEWRLARIPLETLRAAGIKANGLIFQAASAQNQGAVNLADVRLVYYPTSQRAALQRLWMYDLSTITLAFSAPLDPSGLALPAAYTLAPEGSTATNPRAASHPRAVRYHPNPHTISMVMPQPLTPKATYAVTVDYTSKRTGAGVSARFQGTVQVTSNPLALTGDAAANRHGISRDIYGASGLDGNLALDLGAKLRRWGGEQTTRYNWKLGNAFNASRDYYFENGNYNLTSDADQKPSGVADQDIADAHKYDMRYLLTIPTIGWVAKDDNADSRSVDVPDSGGPPFAPGADAIPGY